MAKHRSHIVRPVLAEKNNSKIPSRFDFVFSDDIQNWMHGSKFIADRKVKDQLIRSKGRVA